MEQMKRDYKARKIKGFKSAEEMHKAIFNEV